MAKSYNPRGFATTLSGNPLGGWGDGEAVQIVKSEDDTTETAGIDGEVTITVSHNEIREITLTFKRSSDSNQFMQNQYNIQKAAVKLGLPVPQLPFSMVSLDGRTRHNAPRCWFKKQPDGGIVKDADERQWRLASDEVVSNEGGV